MCEHAPVCVASQLQQGRSGSNFQQLISLHFVGHEDIFQKAIYELCAFVVSPSTVNNTAL